MPDTAPAPNSGESSATSRFARADASLHEEVLARLRDYFGDDNLREGARIPERQLCEMLGVSRTPLREALKVLASEGLIDLLPNRGARVPTLSEQDVRELFDLVAGLEALAGRLACDVITDAEIAAIEALHHEMYAFYMRRDLHGYFQANRQIHAKIVEAARNKALSQAYVSHIGRIRRFRYGANLVRGRERWGEAMREHEALLDALRRRAGAELSDVLFQHLRNNQAAAATFLAESQAAKS